MRIVPALLAFFLAVPALAQPVFVLDILDVASGDHILHRVLGARGTGSFGVPVAGGPDVDGDGLADTAVAYFTAGGEIVGDDSRPLAGEVDLVFGTGTLGGERDSAVDGPDLLRVLGAGERETAGTEVWLADVTGDGLGDLLIGRQNFTPEKGRIGAGALTVIPGGPELRRLAARGTVIDLAAPPPGLALLTLVGAREIDRLGVWMRTGDVDGDGTADVVVGADQEDFTLRDGATARNRGALYVLRGGPHLATRATVDLADFGTPAFETTPLAGHVARVVPPLEELFVHLGATCQIADLDGNGRGEVLAAATVNRAGASINAAGAPLTSAEGSAGVPGALFVVWDDNFPAAGTAWPAGFTLDLAALPGSRTLIRGGSSNNNYGEEIVGGADVDGDGEADLFVGDLLGRHPVTGARVGLGDVFFSAARLRGFDSDADAPPTGLRRTRIAGPSVGSIGADTAALADFDADGLADLVFASPHAAVRERLSAGTVHVIYGRSGGWPALIDTASGSLPDAATVRVSLVEGARGSAPGGDAGDTLAYSATAADLDGDGHDDLIVNEMQGNGVAPEAVDAGNLLLVSGASLTGACRPDRRVLCLQGGRFAVRAVWENSAGTRGPARRVLTDVEDSGLLWFFEADNWEVLAKVLDGCTENGHYWVFTAATTDVGYTLYVTDSATGVRREYVNVAGRAADAVTDTGAFATCP